MKSHHHFFESAEALSRFGEGLSASLGPGVLALSGELGAGKTTLARGILQGMGASGPFSSPTFVLMKEYPVLLSQRGVERIYHVDSYRVQSAELLSQGFLEWVNDPHGLMLLEWPERVEHLLPPDTLRLALSVEGSGRRLEFLSDDKETFIFPEP
ncbi:MAG: tRNA (adenosine(37)-N6)-threonylcarbamoyltransferase complex ATPase subunit type 1 TsaE [Candidatus Moraniibacteriota bacterium]|nr:MAG: tRNA (adenosine(37)-N6)-threonylcarbamoyltransferase complex ATPase subunit type 1 TsaE [Candidatus Moranbacteria bacterium]